MTPVGQTLHALEAQAIAVMEGIKAVKIALDAERRQAELPLPAVTETAQDRFGAPIAGSADPAPTRGALLGYCDAVEDAIERNDAEAAKAALRNLRTALQEL